MGIDCSVVPTIVIEPDALKARRCADTSAPRWPAMYSPTPTVRRPRPIGDLRSFLRGYQDGRMQGRSAGRRLVDTDARNRDWPGTSSSIVARELGFEAAAAARRLK